MTLPADKINEFLSNLWSLLNPESVNSLEGKSFGYLILIIFGLSIATLIYRVLQILWQYRQLHVIRKKWNHTFIPQEDNHSETEDHAKRLRQRMPSLTEILLFQTSIPKRGPTPKLIQRILTTWRKGALYDHDSQIAAFQDTYAGWLAFVRWTTTILVILGLAGTVIGLAAAIAEMQYAVDGLSIDSWDELKNIIKATMDGLSTAFTTTLLGILSTFILSFFVSVANSLLTNVAQKAETFLLDELEPTLFPSQEALLHESYQRMARDMSDTQRVIKQTYDAFLVDLKTVTSQLTNSYEQIFSSVRTSMLDMSNSMGKEVLQVDALFTHLQAISSHFEKGTQNLQDAHLTIRENYTRMQQAQEQNESLYRDLRQEFIRSTDRLDATLKQTEESNVRLNQLSEQLRTVATGLTELIQSLKGERESLRAETSQLLNTHHVQAVTEHSTFLSDLKVLVEGVRSSEERIQQQWSEDLMALQHFSESLTNSVSDAVLKMGEGFTTNILTSLQAQLATIQAAVEANQEAIATSIDTMSNEFSALTSDLAVNFQQLLQQTNQSIIKTSEQVTGTTTAALTTQLKQMQEAVDAFTPTLKMSSDQLLRQIKRYKRGLLMVADSLHQLYDRFQNDHDTHDQVIETSIADLIQQLTEVSDKFTKRIEDQQAHVHKLFEDTVTGVAGIVSSMRTETGQLLTTTQTLVRAVTNDGVGSLRTAIERFNHQQATPEQIAVQIKAMRQEVQDLLAMHQRGIRKYFG